MSVHAFAVALTVKNASPAQNRGLPAKESLGSTPRVTHDTCARHTEHSSTAVSSSGIFFYRDRSMMHRRMAWSPRPHSAAHEKSHCIRSSSSSRRDMQRCFIFGSMRVSHTSRDLQLYSSQGPIKNQPQRRKPQQYSADELPHTRDVADCSAGGRQARVALEPAACSRHPALLVCCLRCVVFGLRTITGDHNH